MNVRQGSCVGVFVVLLVAGIAMFLSAYALNDSAVRAQAGYAHATAQAELLAQSTPVSESAIIAMEGFDTIARVAESGFSSNVRIAQSGDLAQVAMSQAWCMSSWALPVGMLAFAVILWLLKGGKNEDRN